MDSQQLWALVSTSKDRTLTWTNVSSPWAPETVWSLKLLFIHQLNGFFPLDYRFISLIIPCDVQPPCWLHERAGLSPPPFVRSDWAADTPMPRPPSYDIEFQCHNESFSHLSNVFLFIEFIYSNDWSGFCNTPELPRNILSVFLQNKHIALM